MSWTLLDAEEAHAKAPGTFSIPSREERLSLTPGSLVKLLFEFDEGVERMWVRVVRVESGRYSGALEPSPVRTEELSPGDEIRFEARHIAATKITLDDPRHPLAGASASLAD